MLFQIGLVLLRSLWVNFDVDLLCFDDEDHYDKFHHKVANVDNEVENDRVRTDERQVYKRAKGETNEVHRDIKPGTLAEGFPWNLPEYVGKDTHKSD